MSTATPAMQPHTHTCVTCRLVVWCWYFDDPTMTYVCPRH
jgi:hypothetical protein